MSSVVRPVTAARSERRISHSLAASTEASTSSRTRYGGARRERPRQRRPLALAAREREAALADHRVPPVGERLDLLAESGRRPPPRGGAPGRRASAEQHIVPERAGEQEGLLRHVPHRPPQPVRGRQGPRRPHRRRRCPGAARRAGTGAVRAWTCRSPSDPRRRRARPGARESSRLRAPAPRSPYENVRSRNSIGPAGRSGAPCRLRSDLVGGRRRVEDLGDAPHRGEAALHARQCPAERDRRPREVREIGVEGDEGPQGDALVHDRLASEPEHDEPADAGDQPHEWHGHGLHARQAQATARGTRRSAGRSRRSRAPPRYRRAPLPSRRGSPESSPTARRAAPAPRWNASRPGG